MSNYKKRDLETCCCVYAGRAERGEVKLEVYEAAESDLVIDEHVKLASRIPTSMSAFPESREGCSRNLEHRQMAS